jgi:adenosylcobinamide kinase/adenosylcobinamide-phosphate guanylyltransferase
VLRDDEFLSSFPALDGFSADDALPAVTLILGGVRSGKSRFAQKLIERQGKGLYLATAQAGDAEMARRIAEHKARRDGLWTTIEEPIELVAAIESNADPARPILVDCLTLWLSNLMHAGRDVAVETLKLTQAIPDLSGPVMFVSNEVGLGIVPDNALARAFRDHAGMLHQKIAEISGLVVFMAAGLPVIVKKPA